MESDLGGMKRMHKHETFWDKRSQQYDDNIQNHDSLYEKTIAHIRALVADSDVMLDFACASGEWSLDIAPYVQRVHGIDVSGKMIELAKQKARERQVANVSFERVDVFDASLDGNSFSVVVAFNIFHLLDDAPTVLGRLNDLLPTGGLLISQTPCLGERGLLFRSLINLAQWMGFAPLIRSFTFAELESLVSDSNFEIVETQLWDAKNAVQWIVARKT